MGKDPYEYTSEEIKTALEEKYKASRKHIEIVGWISSNHFDAKTESVVGETLWIQFRYREIDDPDTTKEKEYGSEVISDLMKEYGEDSSSV